MNREKIALVRELQQIDSRLRFGAMTKEQDELMSKIEEDEKKQKEENEILMKEIENMCPICLDQITDVGICPIDTRHRFCNECLQQWYRQSRTCPLCREQVPACSLSQPRRRLPNYEREIFNNRQELARMAMQIREFIRDEEDTPVFPLRTNFWTRITLRRAFNELQLSPEAFEFLQYHGVIPLGEEESGFTELEWEDLVQMFQDVDSMNNSISDYDLIKIIFMWQLIKNYYEDPRTQDELIATIEKREDSRQRHRRQRRNTQHLRSQGVTGW